MPTGRNHVSSGTATLASRAAIRLAGVWLLLGGTLKLEIGALAQVPVVLAELGLSREGLYWPAAGVELTLGIAALLSPGAAWKWVVGLLIGFALLLVPDILAGSANCGCFGDVHLHPVLAASIDVVLAGGVLLSRPWRLPRTRGGAVRWATALAVAALLLFVASPHRRGCPGNGDYVLLDVKSWQGLRLEETALRCWLGEEQYRDGLWVFSRASCDLCASYLQELAQSTQGDPVTVVSLGGAHARGDPQVRMRRNGWRVFELPSSLRWVISVPVVAVVREGRVREALSEVARHP